MAQQMKVLATNTDDQSATPGPRWWKERTSCLGLFSDLHMPSPLSLSSPSPSFPLLHDSLTHGGGPSPVTIPYSGFPSPVAPNHRDAVSIQQSGSSSDIKAPSLGTVPGSCQGYPISPPSAFT